MNSSTKVIRGTLPCPKCPSSDAYFEYSDGHGYCFSCKYYKPVKEEFVDLDFTYEFLPWRGINRHTMETYNVRTRIDADGRPSEIGFLYPSGSIKVRNRDVKEFRWVSSGSSGTEPGLFGQDKFTPGGHKHVTITEGEPDALSIHQVLGGPAVSVRSSSSAERDCIGARSWLNSYERIYLAFDNDPNGRAATAAVAKLFDYDKVFHVKFTSRKDANEYLVAGEEAELKNIWWSAKRYQPENIKSSLEEFDKELIVAPKMGVSYPFPQLTKMTYGIRPAEVVLVTAQEKVGKTEFMHTVLHNLLKETKDNVAGLFIEESNRRTLQALAGIELGRPVHLPDSGCSQLEVIEAVHKVVGRDDRLYLFTHDRGDDPEAILDTIRFFAAARACKYVLFDHPGMAVFGGGDDRERILLEALYTKSAMMCRELDFSLIVVSHVNDFGQTRGTRYPGKLCDVRIDLSRDTANEDPIVRNTVNVLLQYSRYSASSGPVGSFVFDERTQKYREAANDNAPHDLRGNKAA